MAELYARPGGFQRSIVSRPKWCHVLKNPPSLAGCWLRLQSLQSVSEREVLDWTPAADNALIARLPVGKDEQQALKRFNEESSNLIRLGLIEVRIGVREDNPQIYFGSNDT